jgi:hypothetical protein
MRLIWKKDYFLYIDDAFEVDDGEDSSELYIDLKQAELLYEQFELTIVIKQAVRLVRSFFNPDMWVIINISISMV